MAVSLIRRISNLFRRERVEADIEAEIRSHVEMRIEANVAAGMTAEEARRDALVKFGNHLVIKERSIGADAALGLDSVGRDVMYALRQLRRSPGFAATAVVTLALGIGANIVVFSVLNAVLLHPLEVRDPQSLYQLRHKAWATGRLLTSSYPALEDYRRRNKTFSGLVGIDAYSHAVLVWRNAPYNLSGDEVTGNYFDLLGVGPEAGRFFHEADEHGPNSAPYVVLSDAIWRGAFAADPSIVGATVDLNRHPFTVVGVAAPQFHGTERFAWADYWVPMVNEEQVEGYDFLHSRYSVAVTVIGRLKSGVTPQQATEDLNAIAGELGKEYPQSDDGQPLRLIHPGLIGDTGDVIRDFLWSVNALALLVLLAACANLATLFAARAADRGRELAVRVALGSSRARLARQLLTEALLVSLLGGAAGLGFAELLLRALNRLPQAVESHLAAGVDARVFGTGMVLTLVSALLFGMLPARQAWQSSPMHALKSGVEQVGLRRFALRDVLLGVQIAICTLLVTASLVAVRGMERTLNAPIGFQPKNALLVDMDLGDWSQTADALLAEQKSLIEAVRSTPGVTAVGTVNKTPMRGGMHGARIFLPGTTNFKASNSVLAPYLFSISPGYLQAAQTRLLSGRDVSWDDTATTPYVALVNETFARKMWGNTPPIGQHFVVSGKLTEVVGVVEDGKYHDLEESAYPVAYLPLAQSEDSEPIFVVRSRRTASEMAAALRHTFSATAPNVPMGVWNWTDSIEGELLPAKAAAVALSAMGLMAAMLAVTGIFGMAAYSVSRRMKELGIRVALGAGRARVMQSAVGRPLGLLLGGLAVGLMLAVMAKPLMRRIVYQAEPRDPLVLLGVLVTMALIGVAAAWIPARRALRVDPSRLMREE